MEQVQIENLERDLNRMKFKRNSLTRNDDATAEDWDRLADEYEELEFKANAANCRRRAERMRENNVP